MSFEYIISPIGRVISPFKEKFGIPRQSGMVSTVESKIRLYEEYSSRECVRGLEDFSHIWILFSFHENTDRGWNENVRPPRLGGNKKTGVFSSRSPFRPNHIGMSAVQLKKIEKTGRNLLITVSGADILDNTPVFDIKPYIKYADSIENAKCGCFSLKPEKELSIVFSPQAEDVCHNNKGLECMLREVLSYDPRPAYYKKTFQEKIFGIKFECFNVRFRVCGDFLHVEEIV